jgi:hypothetical protein
LVSLETLLLAVLGGLGFASKDRRDLGPSFLPWSLLVRLLVGTIEILLFFFMLGLGEGFGVVRELIIVLGLPSEIAILSGWSRSLTRLVVASVILIGVVSITFALGVITF